MTAELMPLASLCRGRLILALQYTLWRLEAWLHEPSWTVTPETMPVPQMIRDSLNELHEALCMGDDALIHICPLLQVVGTCPPACKMPMCAWRVSSERSACSTLSHEM